MRVQRVLLIAAFLGALTTGTASAQAAGREITITKGAHDYVLHLGARIRPVVAGQRIVIRCARVPAPQGFRPSPHPAPVQRTARVPRTRGPVHTGIPVGRLLDLCTVSYTSRNGSGGIVNLLTDSVWVPITARGRADVDDLNAAFSLFVPRFAAPAGATTPPPAATIVARSHGTVAALDGPDATPTAGKVGYWTDGAQRFTTVALGHAGRRLFLDQDADVARTNGLGAFDDPLEPATAPDALPAAAPRLTPGVTVTAGRDRYVLHFAPSAAATYRRIAGHRVAIGCGATNDESPGFGLSLLAGELSETLRAPRRRGPLSTGPGDPSVRYDYCFVRLGHDVVVLAARTARARTYFDEAATAASLSLPVALVAPGTVAPPPAETIVQRSGGRVVALDGPAGTPPPGKVGYWTDGARHYVMAAVTGGGRRLFSEVDGDVIATNAIGYDLEPGAG